MGSEVRVPHQPPQGQVPGMMHRSGREEWESRKKKSMDRQGEREKEEEIKDPRGRLTNSRDKKEGVKSTLNEVRPFGRKQWWSLVTGVYCIV